jgi:predicted GNAT family acetyltransferase
VLRGWPTKTKTGSARDVPSCHEETVPESTAPLIENNVAANRFEVRFPEGLAQLRYRYDRQGRLVLIHTEVPNELGGRGIAGLLARTALEFARAQHLQVVPQCPFVKTYLERHPEYKDLVSEQ